MSSRHVNVPICVTGTFIFGRTVPGSHKGYVLSCFSCRAKKARRSASSLIQPCPPSQNKTFTKCRLIYYWSTCPFSFFFPFCKMDFGVLRAAVDTALRCHLFKSRRRSHIATVLYHLVKCPSDLHLLLCIYYFSQRVA